MINFHNIRKYVLSILISALLVPAPFFVQTSEAATQAQLRQRLNHLQDVLAHTMRRFYDVCPEKWRDNLEPGEEDRDVKELQEFLNMHPDTRLATEGPGSPGNETEFYGRRTEDAVRRFQQKYADQILHPFGRTSPSGIFGTITRKHMNALCDRDFDISNISVGEDTQDDGRDPSDIAMEAEIRNFSISSHPDETRMEADDEDEVLSFEFHVRDADVKLERIDVLFEAVNQDNEKRPWRFVDSIKIEDGYRTVGTRDADQESDWHETSDDVYRIRVEGMDRKLEKDDEHEIDITVETQEFIDSNNLPQDFRVYLATTKNNDKAVRMRDDANVLHYLGDVDTFRVVEFEKD